MTCIVVPWLWVYHTESCGLGEVAGGGMVFVCLFVCFFVFM